VPINNYNENNLLIESLIYGDSGETEELERVEF
jgi:hypothetical protein